MAVSLLLVAKLIPTQEGVVWRPALVLAGPGDLEPVARDHATESHLPVIVPLDRGSRHAYWEARRKIDSLVEQMNALAGL